MQNERFSVDRLDQAGQLVLLDRRVDVRVPGVVEHRNKLSRRTSTLEGCTSVSSNGSMPSRPAAISARMSRSRAAPEKPYRQGNGARRCRQALVGAGRAETWSDGLLSFLHVPM